MFQIHYIHPIIMIESFWNIRNSSILQMVCVFEYIPQNDLN